VPAPSASEEAETEQGWGEGAEQEWEEGEAEEQEQGPVELWPLLSGAEAAGLTGGLTMAGRRPLRKTIVFAVDIAHAESMTSIFNAAGVGACWGHVWGAEPQECLEGVRQMQGRS
jgi:type I site-specific restriction endonuclease